MDLEKYAELLKQADVFMQKNLLMDALTVFKEALLIYPHSTEVMMKLASLYSNMGRPEKAIKTCRRIIDLMQDDTPIKIRAQLMELEKKHLVWDTLEDDFKFFQEEENLQTGVLPPFFALSNPLNNEQLLKTISKSVKHTLAFQPKPRFFSFADRKKTKQKLKLGFVSGDLRNHPVGFVLSEFFELIDREKFDVYLYDTHPDNRAETHHRIYSTTPNITAIDKVDDKTAAQKIFDDGIDVLIDLSGHTSFNRLGIFPYHPAPAQGTFLGFLGTLGGVSGVDYNIADEFSVPSDQQKYYAEKIKYIEPVHRLIDRKMRLPDGVFTRQSFGIPEDAIILNCFNNSYKYTPNYFDLWARILKRVPKAILWFYKMDSFTEKNMLAELLKRDISEDRIFFTEFMPHWDHLGRYSISDLFLDTEYYNAHTTAMEALYMGCPMITCPGNTFTSRAGGAILSALDMPQMICKDIQEYEEKVVELCHTPGALKKLREETIEKSKTADLFNTEKFTRSFEKIVREMYEESCENVHQETAVFQKKNIKKINASTNVHKKSVLVFEAQPHHGECLPSYIKYFNDLGFHVDMFVLPEMIKQNPFVRLPKDADYSVIEIPHQNRKAILKDIKISDYEHVLISTAIYDYRNPKSVLQEFEIFKTHPSVYIVEHDLRYMDSNNEREYATNHKMITLWDFKTGTMVNPSYFGNVRITPKNVTTFIVVGNVTKMRKNYQLLFDAVQSLIKKNKNFHVIIIGRVFDKYSIPDEIKPYVTLTGALNFPEMYNYMEKADFFLPLLDNNNTHHNCYLNSVTTGSLQLILGFRKIPLIQEEFAKFYGFNSENALTYSDNLESTMLKAINMAPEAYQKLQECLGEKAEKVMEKSQSNLQKILSEDKPMALPSKKLNVYCFTSYFNFGDQLNFDLLRYLNYPMLKTSREEAEAIFVGSLLEHFFGNRKLNDRPLHVCGCGFLYPPASPHEAFCRDMVFHALRGKLSKNRCEAIVKRPLNNVVLGDPGLLIKRMFPNLPKEKKYEVGIILHEYDRTSALLQNIKFKDSIYTIFDTSLPSEEFVQKVAQCDFIFSSALHGIICADSLGVPNQHIVLSPTVGGYKFHDYYSVFDNFSYKPINLNTDIIDEKKLIDLRDGYQDRITQIDSICEKLMAVFEDLKLLLL